MKKNRSSFFTDNNVNYSGFNPMVVGNGYQASSNTSFYEGPMNYQSDIYERFAKIERQINRLDYRLNKLESKNIKSTDEYDNSNDMYMI